jgi:hypothetical protein
VGRLVEQILVLRPRPAVVDGGEELDVDDEDAEQSDAAPNSGWSDPPDRIGWRVPPGSTAA